MSASPLKKYGSLSARDSGAPSARPDYTTLIILHGIGWHSAIFDKLFPLADSRNIRLVAPNRPGYPGSAPSPEQARSQLSKISEASKGDPDSAANAHLDYIKEDVKKTLDFLVDFISEENIPLKGGIILAGWSQGVVTLLGLLAYAGAMPFRELKIDLRPYIKHLVLYDAPSCLLGYAPPPGVVDPLFDPSLTPDEALAIFPGWFSAYYAHGEDITEIEYKALDNPPPTIPSMNPLDVERCLEINAVLSGGFDDQVLRLGVQLGTFSRLRESAMFPDQRDPPAGHEWDSVEIKYVWCDHSTWEIPWGVQCLQSDLIHGEKAGRVTRKVDMVRLRGGNHFCHWDMPDLALTGLLSGL